MTSFTLGNDGSDQVIVRITGRPDAQDDWLDASISVRAGAFSASIPVSLSTCDFRPFREQLEALYQTLDGTAAFNTREQQLGIVCRGNGLGGIAVEGVTNDQVSDGNTLRLQFNIDQSFLPAIIEDLREVEAAFPNRVHPP
ncbi:DUF5959 family protein [uncultured Rubinisphaera sp.]|uniref:WapI family immunity protein n=1 Tax=uncultured Rubinisphaera sp. TaxID=1678686 RepID=UPI0030D8777B|tara:strand:- start:898 stop:1320 length:423 start_codon:yes stop_codon:yes gene_type:complete